MKKLLKWEFSQKLYEHEHFGVFNGILIHLYLVIE